MSLEDLQQKHRSIQRNIETGLSNMQTIADESYRVANVAHNSELLLDNLDKEFQAQTGLNGIDITFLFFATALQCCRILLVNNLSKIEKAGHGNRNEDHLHNIQNKISNKAQKAMDTDKSFMAEPQEYYAPLNQILTGRGVPYDATRYLNENYKLFKGANHRFATLGHDPILGLIFGTANILTNTITCINTPFITTNHVVYDLQQKNPQIGSFASTTLTLKKAAARIDGDAASVISAVIKQIIHIGTDLYTPCGIQLPGANLLLSKANAEKLTRYISSGDLIKVGTSAGISSLVNTIISTCHLLMYDETRYHSYDVYNVKTKRIILYSNEIATYSNAIWTGAKVASGNLKAINELDIAGLVIIIQKLLTDTNFIQQVKEEFIIGGFNKIIQGDKLNLKEIKI